MSANKGETPISEKFMNTNDLFGLRYSNGLVFCEVDGFQQVEYKPYTKIGTVPAQSATGWKILKNDGDEILHIPNNEQKVMHAAVGQNSSTVRRYTNFPEAENRLRKLPNLGSPSASRGEDYGYVDGDSSPYSEPTDAEEMFVPPGESIDFNFYNPNDREEELALSIKARVYEINALDPQNTDNESAIRRIVRPGSAPPIANVGSFDRQASFNFQSEWGVEPVTLERIRNGI